MAALKVKKLWTVFITAFFAVLASLGFSTPAAAAGTAVQQPAEQPVPAPAGEAGGTAEAAEAADPVPVRATVPRAAGASRDRSLPPTIRQRITAEAHGSSPSVRHLPADTHLSAGAPNEANPAADAALVGAGAAPTT
ncbi:DUF6344 domain-containing protein [Streptomyces sp. NPDC057617]|uniref:DUF6344 domain-containing protein n=1 Tax=unclassified Streptomyces TaxID=2593676 RepID=UPI0036A33478